MTDFLQETLSVRQTLSPILLDRLVVLIPLTSISFRRDCSNGQFFPTSGDVRPCFQQCETTTRCGTATVPQDHLLVKKQR